MAASSVTCIEGDDLDRPRCLHIPEETPFPCPYYNTVGCELWTHTCWEPCNRCATNGQPPFAKPKTDGSYKRLVRARQEYLQEQKKKHEKIKASIRRKRRFLEESQDTINELAKTFRVHKPLAMTDGQLADLRRIKEEKELAEEENADMLTRIEEKMEQLDRHWNKLCHAQFAYTCVHLVDRKKRVLQAAAAVEVDEANQSKAERDKAEVDDPRLATPVKDGKMADTIVCAMKSGRQATMFITSADERHEAQS